jgi:ABC-type branched-subunit amino acid transport system ATPase component
MAVMTSSAIAVSGLRKAYGDKTVLDGIDLEVPAGTVFSLLGPNGAGKTTTVNVLTTLTKADGGTVRVAGHDVAADAKAVRAVIGVTGQFAAVDDLLTGEENLQHIADLHQLRAGEGNRLVAEGAPDELKRLVTGGHVRLRFAGAAMLDAAARILGGAVADDAALTLRLPSDGGVRSLRALLNRLDEHSIDVEEFSVNTPDLDDVFLT